MFGFLRGMAWVVVGLVVGINPAYLPILKDGILVAARRWMP